MSAASVFGISAVLLVISIISFVYFIKVNRRNKVDFDKKLDAYNKAVARIKQEEEQRVKKAAQEKKTAARTNPATNVAYSPRRIQFMAPSGASYDVPMTDQMTIGNNPRCDLCIKKTGVEPLHCKVTYSDGVYMMTDLGTSSGTFFDGTRLSPNTPMEIKTGVLQLGRVTLFMTVG